MRYFKMKMPEIHNISKGFRRCYNGALFKECDDNEQWSVLTRNSKRQNKVNFKSLIML